MPATDTFFLFFLLFFFGKCHVYFKNYTDYMSLLVANILIFFVESLHLCVAIRS